MFPLRYSNMAGHWEIPSKMEASIYCAYIYNIYIYKKNHIEVRWNIFDTGYLPCYLSWRARFFTCAICLRSPGPKSPWNFAAFAPRKWSVTSAREGRTSPPTGSLTSCSGGTLFASAVSMQAMGKGSEFDSSWRCLGWIDFHITNSSWYSIRNLHSWQEWSIILACPWIYGIVLWFLFPSLTKTPQSFQIFFGILMRHLFDENRVILPPNIK